MKKRLTCLISLSLLIALFLIGCSPNTAIHVTEWWAYDPIHGDSIFIELEVRFDRTELSLLENSSRANGTRWNGAFSGHIFFHEQGQYFMEVGDAWNVRNYLRTLLEPTPFNWVTISQNSDNTNEVVYRWRARFDVEFESDADPWWSGFRSLTGENAPRSNPEMESRLFWNTHTFEWEHPFNSYINDFHHAQENPERVHGVLIGTNIMDKLANGWEQIGADGGRQLLLPSFFDAFPIARYLDLEQINLFYHWYNNSRVMTNGVQSQRGQNTVHTFSTRIGQSEQNDQLILQMRRANTISWNILSIILGLIVSFGIIYFALLFKRQKEKPSSRAEDYFPYDPNA
ncbi:MAG: hypothetical protein FWC11_03945 [Firmicutes bacterium]|nr:hypothetical protein [Bacillota bacterium]